MKQTKTLLGILACSLFCIANFTYAQQKTSPDTQKKLQQKYNSYGPKQEISFEQFQKINSKSISAQANGFYDGCDEKNTVCGNRDFETGLDMTEWQGGFGTWAGGDPDPSQLTEGFISGDLFDANAHQTIVTTAIDPIVGISTTNSKNANSKQALRLGNAINGFGTELISKTITVTAAQTIIPFFYAVIFEDPQHPPLDQPWFSVRVFDCSNGQELTGVCDLGNGSNHVVSDRTNPFFNCSSTSGCNVLYRDWTRAEINLSNFIGKKVNIQFLNKDCGQGGHYGYTYLDDLGNANCGGNPPPTDTTFYIIRNIKQSDTCGAGQICVDYILPKDTITDVTGDVNIDLNIYQNGNLITTINSGTQTKDSSTYCFSISPALLGIDTSVGAFDYTLTGHFSLEGFPQSPQTLGNPPDGQLLGQNNDYYVTTCPSQQNNAPFFVAPSPADGSTINAHPGEMVTFTVKAKDNDAGDKVMLTATGIPSGATTAPALPATGNPVSAKFSWMPSANMVGTYPVAFTATDDSGKTAMRTVIVQVTSSSCGDSSFRPFVFVYPPTTVYGQAHHTIYKGYGRQNVVLTAVPRGGSGNLLKYRFKWDDGSRLPIRLVSPNVTTTYNVDITDGSGCTAHASVTIWVVDVTCGANYDKVMVCDNGYDMCVDSSQVAAMLMKGAKLGSCGTKLTAPLTSSRMAAPSTITKTIQPASFTAYPNPARSDIRFKWNMNVSGNAKINIMDLQGRVIITQSVTSTGQSINISKLSNGVYMAQLTIDGKPMGTTRFTVSK